jgi:putative redox protein
MEYKFKNPVSAKTGTEKYQCTIQWRNGKFIADEPESSGGKDTGPDPHTLLLSSVAACKLITMRMYIDRKGWDIPEIAVNANMYKDTIDGVPANIIDCDVSFPGPVDDDKKLRLQQVAAACPITKILEGKTVVRTFMQRSNENDKKIEYSNDEITVIWKPELCQHSQRCFRQLPQVFDPQKKKWIDAAGAPADEIARQVDKCPSGALTYYLNKDKKRSR